MRAYLLNPAKKLLALVVLIPIVGLASELKVSSFNVNFNNVKVRETLGLINKFDPDVILIQEATEKIEQGATNYLSKSYAFSWFTATDRDTGGGYAIISKFPLVDKRYIPKSAGIFGAQSCGVSVRETTIQLINIHLNPASLPKPYSRSSAMHAMMMNNKNQVLETRNILKQYREDRPTIIAGDLNSFPSLSAYKRLTARGLIDAHLSIDPKAHTVSTWQLTVDNTPLQGRFDYVFHNRLLQTKEFNVVTNVYSDHALLNCTLQLKE